MDLVKVAFSSAMSQVAYARLGAEGIEAYDKLLSRPSGARVGDEPQCAQHSILFEEGHASPFWSCSKGKSGKTKKQFVLAEGGSPILRQTLPQKLPCQASYLAERQRPGTGSEHTG